MLHKKIVLYFLNVGFWVTFFILSLLAYHFFWFWKITWFDIVVHLLAGISLGLTGLIIYFSVVKEEGEKIIPTWEKIFIVSFVTVLVAGVVWELFEFSINQYWETSLSVKQLAVLKFSLNDTSSDLLADILGGFVAAVIFKLFNFKLKSIK